MRVRSNKRGLIRSYKWAPSLGMFGLCRFNGKQFSKKSGGPSKLRKKGVCVSNQFNRDEEISSFSVGDHGCGSREGAEASLCFDGASKIVCEKISRSWEFKPL